MEAHDASIDGAGRNDKSAASTTMFSSCASATITGAINVWSPKWFAKNVRQVWDRVVGRPCRYREIVRSEMAIPSFNNSPWIRGAPQDNSQRPYAESDLDRVSRCVVFQDVASDAASIDVRVRDANDRRWLAGSAPALPAIGATTTAKTTKTDGQLDESASSNERGRRVGGAGQESRAGGLDASPGPIGPQPPS
jgi:hypothetical protein